MCIRPPVLYRCTPENISFAISKDFPFRFRMFTHAYTCTDSHAFRLSDIRTISLFPRALILFHKCIHIFVFV